MRPFSFVCAIVGALFAILTTLAPAGGPYAAHAEEFTVGLDAYYEPFSFPGPQGYTGFDVEVLDALTETMGTGYTIKPMAYQELAGALARGKIDAAMSGLVSTEQTADGLEFTKPYFRDGLRILVRTDSVGLFTLDGLAGKTVGTKLGSDAFFYLYDNILDVTVSQFPDIRGAYDALLNHELDAVFFEALAVGHFSMTHGFEKAMPVGPLYQSKAYGIALPRGSAWTARLNDALARIREDGTLDKIYEDWFGAPPE